MAVILALLTAIIVFSGYLLFDKIIADKKHREAVRARIAPDGSSIVSQDEPFSHLNGEPSPGVAALATLLRGLGVNVDNAVRKLERRFAQAGIHAPNAPIIYLFFQRIASLGLLIIGLILFTSAHGDSSLLIKLISLFVIIGGLFGPKLYLQNMIDKRKKTLQRAFPDTLDLLLICVESGMSVELAFRKVSTEIGTQSIALAEEFTLTTAELSYLSDRKIAYDNLQKRTGLDSVRSVCMALSQSERYGTPLSMTLRVMAQENRDQRMTEAEKKAAALPPKLTVPMMLFFLPVLFVVILGPVGMRVSALM